MLVGRITHIRGACTPHRRSFVGEYGVGEAVAQVLPSGAGVFVLLDESRRGVHRAESHRPAG